MSYNFQKDDIPPETLDATTHSTLMNLWTQRIHIEETLENLLNNSLDIDIDDEFERLDDIHNTINRRMFDTHQAKQPKNQRVHELQAMI